MHRGHACLDTELFEHVKVYLLYYIIDWTLHRDLGGRNVRLVEFVVHASFLKGKHVSVALIPLTFIKNTIVAVTEWLQIDLWRRDEHFRRPKFIILNAHVPVRILPNF